MTDQNKSGGERVADIVGERIAIEFKGFWTSEDLVEEIPAMIREAYAPLSRTPAKAGEDGVREALQGVMIAEIVDDCGWSLSLLFGKGDANCDRMRRASDMIRALPTIEEPMGE